MDISELFSTNVQRNYCGHCNGSLDLAFECFDEKVSGIRIRVTGLPTLRCHACSATYLPDRSRVAVISLHNQAFEQASDLVEVTRRKTADTFAFTSVPFLYDSDDYYYIPGLQRQFDPGFLTPVFFRKEVLLKYDVHPSYQVSFASRTYGTIWQGPEFSIPFGINRFDHVVMWLGDVAQLPETEQYYLRSENVQSDHSIGSEFYDGQIECIFTDKTSEDRLLEARSAFLDACFKRFEMKVAHLDAEVLDLALQIRRPVVDTSSERRSIADTLNKVYLESLDNKALEHILAGLKMDAGKLGSLKRLQKLIEAVSPGGNVASAMSPLYVLYDLRVVYSHLLSSEGQEQKLKTVHQRLGLPEGSDLFVTYDCLIEALAAAFNELTVMVANPGR